MKLEVPSFTCSIQYRCDKKKQCNEETYALNFYSLWIRRFKAISPGL